MRHIFRFSPTYVVKNWKGLGQLQIRYCSNDSGFTKTIFSGIQPTGIPHIGNYFGAVKHWVGLQTKYEKVIFSVVDLHSLTTVQDPAAMKSNIIDMVACLLACGINPDKSILFQQSSVSCHSELAWVLGCLTTMPKLQHLPQWKEKSKQMKEVPLGLFTYPVLQAADILLYKATHVPVGEDQVQHIELTRHLAKLFNKRFNVNYFPQPKVIITDFKRIKSLRTMGSKMSKSEQDPKGRIELDDSADEIHMKLKKAVSDFSPEISYDPETRPNVSNLIDIHSAFTEMTPTDIVDTCSDLNTVQYKDYLADIIIEKLNPIRNEIIKLKQDIPYLEKILQDGSNKASEIAENNNRTIKQIVGFIS